jgi:type II secretory pathway component PulF
MRLALARFSRFLEQQYRSGIPIVQALRQSEGVTGNARIGQSVHAIRHGVEQGEKLAVMAARVGCFPRLIVRMLATGEETGHLEETLRKAGNQFEAEGTEAVKRMFTIVEPCLLLAVGGIMLFIFLAILLPIYTLQGAIHG